MVKLTYNIIEGGVFMADFCLDCWNKINGTNYTEKQYIISEELGFCEECQKITNVIVAERWSYYLYKFRFVILPFKIIWRILILPYLIYKYIKHTKNKQD